MKRQLWPVYLVLFATLIASLAAAITVGSLIEARARTQFINSADQWTRHLEVGLSKYLALLDSVRALAVANVSMNLGQFEAYLQALELPKNYPGISGLGLAVKIAASQRAELIQKARQEGMAQFRVWPETDSSEICPIVILEPPNAANLATLRYDIFAQPQLNTVARTAATSGKTAATEAIRPVVEPETSPRPIFFVFTPIYRGGGLPETSEKRLAAFMGIVLCAFEPVKLLQNISNMGRHTRLDLRVYDGDSLIYESPDASEWEKTWKTTTRVSVAGREWTCVFSSHRVWSNSFLSPGVLTMLLGIVVSGLICAITATQVRARSAAEGHAAQIKQLNVGLERRVADRTAALETAVEDLKAFSYSVSHDLRAPLRHIHGYVSMLQENPSIARDGEARYSVESIARAARSMSELVEALLKFAHVGQIDLALTAQMSVRDLVTEVREILSEETKNRQIQWTIGDLPTVTADRTLLRQVFVNLLTNAIKYSAGRSKAHIEIGCKENDREFEFYVRDNGVGFDMKYAHKLFGMFQRLHKNEEFEGTGIGLANVRKIVSRHGGRTWAESAPDQGAVFYFTLLRQMEVAKNPDEKRSGSTVDGPRAQSGAFSNSR